MSLDFSDVYKGSLAAFSPNGELVASAVDHRLIVRSVETLQVVQLYTCLDKIQRLEWAANSAYVLCALYKKALVQAWSVADSTWTCKIDEGPAGLVHARWSPDCLHILCTADFSLRLSVWSLTDRACYVLKGPKHASAGVAFSPSGAFLAVLERTPECRDALTVYSTAAGWKPAARFELATVDAEDISYAPSGATIAVWDTVLEYTVLLYTPDGELRARYSAYANALGVRAVAWSPCAQMVAVGSFDGAARVLAADSGAKFAEFKHGAAVRGPPGAVVYREEEEAPGRSRYAVSSLPLTLPTAKPVPDKPAARMGVGLLAWSSDSRWLATRNDSTPCAVWVWDVAKLGLAAVLWHAEAVRSLAWEPGAARLAVATGSTRVYLWAPEGASCVHVPAPGLKAAAVAWSPAADGSFLLSDAAADGAFCCAYPADGGD